VKKMNLLNYLGPASNELQLALKDSGYTTLEEYMKERSSSVMAVEERIAYYLGQVNLIAEIAKFLDETNKGDEEE